MLPVIGAGGRTRRWIRIGAAMAVLLLAALAVFILPRAGTALVVSSPLGGPPDAIVSLASHEWERLPETARWALATPGAQVVLTQPQTVTELNCHDCSGRVGRLERLGIARERIVTVPLTSRGTHGEAVATLHFARESGIRRLLVVTSPYHTRRALATFRKVAEASGIEVGMSPATATSPAMPAAWWRTPYDRWYVRYEWSATLYYSVRYGIYPGQSTLSDRRTRPRYPSVPDASESLLAVPARSHRP